MKLIDNRYKVDRILEDNLYGSVYEVTDFWNNDRKMHMKLYNTDKQKTVIDYLTNNFIVLSKFKHENLLTSDRFSIINTIDRKKVSVKQYYSTTEYIDSPSLDKVYKSLSFKEKLNIILQLCNVLGFLHYKGVVYKYLSPSNIFLLEDGRIKIMDLVTIHERLINKDYDDLTRYFIAPEVLLEHVDTVNKNADKYSLGMLIIYLLTEDFYKSDIGEINYTNLSQLDNGQIEFLNKVIMTLIKRNSIVKEDILRKIIDNINKIFGMDYKYDLVKERSTLNFDTKIIGRKKEIEKILRIDNEIINSKDYRKEILIKGKSGVGKTKLLKEITYLLKMRGRDVFCTEITKNNNIDIEPMTSILRQIIKDAPKDILRKYGKEFARVLPELRYLLDIESCNDLKGYKERLRLYDRITSFLEDISKYKPVYIIIDNIENSNDQFLFLLDYIIKNIKRGTIILIVSFNEKMMSPVEKRILNSWATRESAKEIIVSNLDLSEIGGFIQHILGISYKPIKFSAVMLKETQGNPKHIEYIMKTLYATGELFFHEEGFWEIKTHKYSDIYFPSNVDETLKSQLSLIGREYMDIMEIISIYNSSISKSSLLEILDIDIDDLNRKMDKLISMKLLDERVADWGYSYSINNIQLKKLIYHKIPQEKKVKLHKEVSQFLEYKYSKNYKGMLEELIYHLIYSGQLYKALEYIIKEARAEVNIFSSKSIVLWEEAYEIANDIETEYRFEILENLGRIYFKKGNNNKALRFYEELLNESKRLEKVDSIVEANIGIGRVYLRKNLTDLSFKKAIESIELSKRINYLDGLVESQLLYNDNLLNDAKKIDKAEKNLNEILEFTLNNKLDKHLGNIYNMIGLVEHYKGNIENAILRYKQSMVSFHVVDECIEFVKPMNNIANIYIEYGEFKKAMEYYQKGLDIVERYGILNLQLLLLNNIGSAYMGLYNYQKGKKYLEKARTIAIEVENINMLFLANVNLGLIYLLTGDYEQGYNFYLILKESYNVNKLFDFDINGYYYNFLGEFYYIFGKWDECIKYSKKSMEICKEFCVRDYITSKSRLVFVKYFKDKLYDKDSIEDIRVEFRDIKLNYDRRKALIYLSIVPLLEGDYNYVLDILEEDNKLKKDYSVPSFDYIRKILLYCISKNEDIVNIKEDIKRYNLTFIDVFANALLGFKFFKAGKDYQAINYLLESLYLMYRLIKNISDKDLQINYIKSRGGDTIKAKAKDIIEEFFGKTLDCIYTDDLSFDDNIEKYFDYKPLLNIMNDDEFTKMIESNYLYEGTKDVYSIETLIQNLTGYCKFNLELILKYLAKETFSRRGYIFIYDEETNKYLPVVSLKEDKNWSPNENLVALVNRREKGVLITNNLGANVVGLYKDFLPKDTRALICIPIASLKSNNLYQKEDRRKNKIFNNQRNIGYIYLETDRVFNRFDEVRYKLANSFSQIIYINMKNLKLKTVCTIDKLTGIYNRKYFENEINNVLNEAKMTGETFALLMIDIDKFKDINDTYGHRKGDEVLNKIGSCLNNSVRNTDLVARYGGEEFIIILRNIGQDEAIKRGEKIREKIEEINISKIECHITVSIGISMFPKHTQFKEELIEKADQALYRAKEKGRNMVEIWDAYLNNTLNRVDKLAGILSGNTNEDQRSVLAILDVIDLVKKDSSKEEKIFKFLGRLIEILEAENCVFIEIHNKEIIKSYSRSSLTEEWLDNFFVNPDIVKRVIANGRGEFLIDWEGVEEIDIVSNTPNWQSVIIIPLIFSGKMKGIIYITVPIREKEFDYNSYNLAEVLCGIFSTVV